LLAHEFIGGDVLRVGFVSCFAATRPTITPFAASL